MDYVTGKPIAAVKLEGTISVDGKVKPGVIEKLKELQKTYYIKIVSPRIVDSGGVIKVFSVLRENNIPYDEVWALPGIPDAELWLDDAAKPLSPVEAK